MASKNFTSIDDMLGARSSSKEGGPSTAEFNADTIQEVVEHEPDPEVESFVSPRSDSIELPPDLKKLGLSATKTTKFPKYKNIKLPLSDEKIVVGMQAPVTSSMRWLSTWATYLLAQAHLGLKTVGGKVIRVFKN